MRSTLFYSVLASGITSALGDASISTFPNSLNLAASFDPIKSAYWTGLPHHRRTPFSISPDGKSAYLAYLDHTYATVHVQQVSLTDFSAVGDAISVTAYEAAGLVAQNDGFALMATVNATGTANLPTDGSPIVSIMRYTNGKKTWETALNGPGVHASDMLTSTPDANGDLVYSAKAGLYAGYFVVEAYTTDYAGHFGDSIQYVNDNGELQVVQGASSDFGCSHNTGIGLEAADAAPFASVCAEDQGDIWLNTETQYMSGQKISNENTTNGVSGEPMGGMSGSYSNLASIPGSDGYIFAWQSRGALDLTLNAWMGTPYTQCSPRWLNHNVAISVMTDKKTLAGAQASSTVGAAEGDSQVTWITYSSTEDHQNVHIAAVNSQYSIVTYETLSSPDCQPVPMGCSGTYAGTSFQVIDNTGAKVGSAVVSTEAFVSGDIITVGTDKVCWPYVSMTWDLSSPKDSGSPVSKMSFACATLSGNTTKAASVASSSSSSSAAASIASASPSVAAVVSHAVLPSSSVAPIETPSSVPSSTVPAAAFSAPTAFPSTTLKTKTKSRHTKTKTRSSSEAAAPSGVAPWDVSGFYGDADAGGDDECDSPEDY
ncbi:700cb822-c2cd-41ec-a2bd-f26133829b14 [Sclerotinia trifoliorum]|uniref:700cb822-c2cd-41ec-a2bd-f26133829b14 n=1 Tax=Sclerotinia trifoliorum TaxID=28548 RepID=A0A8H2VZI3_9HELO|nr:700cb822-c2cd-41ec-a2bd-f26133829b14 [Sclerotinia trifoliorum]